MADLEKVDINSLEDGAAYDINTDKSVYDMPPPPPDGTYRAKIKLRERDGSLWHQGTTQNGAKYLKTEIEARIIDPGTRFDDLPLFDNFVSTMVMGSSGTNAVASILKELGVALPSRTTDKELAQLLTKAVGDGVEIGIVTQWRASVDSGEKKANGKAKYTEVKGMKKFKQLADGSHDPIISINGQEASAQASIQRYKSLASGNGASA